MTAPTGWTIFIANNIQDASGKPLAQGTLELLPTDGTNQPITVTVGSTAGGAILTQAASLPVFSGSVGPDSLAVAQQWRGQFNAAYLGGYSVGDVVEASGLFYVSAAAANSDAIAGSAKWTALPNQLPPIAPDTALTRPANAALRVTIKDATGTVVYRVPYVYPTGASFNFDTFQPNVGAQAVVQTGPIGPTGFSAYQLWLAAGNVGTVAQFLASLQGDVSAVSFADFMAIALANPSRNWASAAQIVPGTYLNYPDGTSGPLAGWTSYRGIPANAGGSMVINQPVSATNPNGIAFYTVGGVFISGIPGTNTVPQVVTVPANAAYMAFGIIGGPYGAVGVYWGSTLPAASSTEFAVTSDITSAVAALQAQTATSYTPKNIFNPANVHATSYISCVDGSLGVAGGGFQTFGASDFCAILPGQQFVLNCVQSAVNGVGLAFYENGTFVSGIQSANQAPGTVFTAPLNCNQMRTTLQTTQAPTFMAWTGTAVPAAYVPFGGSLGAVALAAAQSASYPGLMGKKFAVHGDSITVILANYWQTQVAAKTGMVKVYQNGQAGRTTAQAFTDYTGSGNTYASYPGQTANLGCTIGNTFAQDITAAAPDIAIIELGTNDAATPIGTPGDPATAATLCGNVLMVLNAYGTAVPACRIMWLLPYRYNPASFGANVATLQAICNAIQQTCALSGVPVANMLAESGIGANTWSLYLLDGVHINNAGADACYVPLILTTLGKVCR